MTISLDQEKSVLNKSSQAEAVNKKVKWDHSEVIDVEDYNSTINFEVNNDNDTHSYGRGSIGVDVFALEGEEDTAVKLQIDGKLSGDLFIKGVWTFAEPESM